MKKFSKLSFTNASYSHNAFSWVAGVGAYLFWALMPLYWRLFEGTSAFIIFLHRSLWAFPFLLLVSFLPMFRKQKKFDFSLSKLPWLCLSGVMIGANWWIYIYGVSAHKVLEMSLGYFISPLLSSALGVVFLKERLSKNQWIGVALVASGVTLYGLRVGYVPTMALGLAFTFSAYSLIRKIIMVPPMTALTTETLALFVLSTLYLVMSSGQPEMQAAWDNHALLLVLGGTMTAIPLLWFAVAVRGLTMTTMGMLNYISPTGKFLIAVLVFHENVSIMDLLFFGIIWTGIFIYLRATLLQRGSR